MKLTWSRQTLRARHTFNTAQSSVSEKQTIVVRLDHAGIAGFGEAVPSTLYGQTLESAEAALGEIAPGLGEDPFLIGPLVERMIRTHDEQRAAVCAVESALFDWVGKRLSTPVWRLLGLARPGVHTTFTIGAAAPGEIREKLHEALADGFDRFKVKVGTEQDEETLSIIRESFAGPLLLDANQAWSAGAAVGKVRDLARYRPTLIEQPVPREEWRGMAEIRSLGVAPVFADESCERPADVLRLNGYIDGVNIKFNKCGGIRQALEMIAIARALGMKVMLGCFLSSSLAIAHALTIATLADFNDLDGALLMANDPFTGLTRSGSLLDAGERAGLGVTL